MSMIALLSIASASCSPRDTAPSDSQGSALDGGWAADSGAGLDDRDESIDCGTGAATLAPAPCGINGRGAGRLT